MQQVKVALITGAARRVGAAIAEYLHEQGMQIVIHYHHSKQEAESLAKKLNQKRANSVQTYQCDLREAANWTKLIEATVEKYGRLDVLVNNASTFFPTQIPNVGIEEWNELFTTNLQVPYFLAQAASFFLKETNGSIINITDIHASKPLKNHSVYCMAKAGLKMMTQSLAQELGPKIRVNAVAPGAVAWPEDENELDETIKDKIISKTALKREGKPLDVALAVWSLINQNFVTGQTLAVDGGRL